MYLAAFFFFLNNCLTLLIFNLSLSLLRGECTRFLCARAVASAPLVDCRTEQEGFAVSKATSLFESPRPALSNGEAWG